MKGIEVTALDIAERFLGIAEVPGHMSNPLVLAMLQLDAKWPADDEVAWCSAYCNFIAWLLNLPRSKSLAARSWLAVGTVIPLAKAEPGFDVVILSRGDPPQPGPLVIDAPGHVGFFAGFDRVSGVKLLAGNQHDAVSIATFRAEQVLGVRRLVT